MRPSVSVSIKFTTFLKNAARGGIPKMNDAVTSATTAASSFGDWRLHQTVIWKKTDDRRRHFDDDVERLREQPP